MERLTTVDSATLEGLVERLAEMDCVTGGVLRREVPVQYGPIRRLEDRYYAYVLLRGD